MTPFKTESALERIMRVAKKKEPLDWIFEVIMRVGMACLG